MRLSVIDEALDGIVEAIRANWDEEKLEPPLQLQKGALTLVHQTPALGVHLQNAEIEERVGGAKYWSGTILVDTVLRGYRPEELEGLLTKYALMVCECVEKDPSLGGRVQWASPRGVEGIFMPRGGEVFERGMRVRIYISATEVK